jgi:L-aspartate oxidase
MRQADVIIIGSGLAGLFTALNIDSKKKVLILQKGKKDHSNSNLAQGGIAAVMSEDSQLLNQHLQDTLRAGAYFNRVDAVEVLVHNAKKSIERLVELGCSFDRDEELQWLMTKEGGHSLSRVLHAGGDASGYKTTSSLLQAIQLQCNITLLEDVMVTNVILDEFHQAIGVEGISNEGYVSYFSPFIVIATGGIGSVYGSTTNDLSSTADGIGIAYRIQATIEHMEFVQFHPTALHEPLHLFQQRFLITEALRGEGAYLRNIEGYRFMEKYDPIQLELSSRDIVSQAIVKEMYDTWTDHVYLDTLHISPHILEERFPTVYKRCLEAGFKLGIDLIPVSPCEHFSCGGIKTNTFGQTSISNLYAVGEVASSGVHGANRLASNSLLECIVFGQRVATHINTTPPPVLPSKWVEKLTPVMYHYNYKPIRKKIKDTMDEYVSIVRQTDGMQKAMSILNEIYQNLMKYPNQSVSYFETLNMATTAKIITEQALARKESIGCHLRIK